MQSSSEHLDQNLHGLEVPRARSRLETPQPVFSCRAELSTELASFFNLDLLISHINELIDFNKNCLWFMALPIWFNLTDPMLNGLRNQMSNFDNPCCFRAEF